MGSGWLDCPSVRRAQFQFTLTCIRFVSICVVYIPCQALPISVQGLKRITNSFCSVLFSTLRIWVYPKLTEV